MRHYFFLFFFVSLFDSVFSFKLLLLSGNVQIARALKTSFSLDEMLFLLLFALVSRDLCLFSSGYCGDDLVVCDRVYYIYSCCFSCCCVMRVLAVVLWRNVLTSGVSCRALNRNNCLFSSLFFSSFFLFFPPPCEEEVSAFLLLALNPDSRAQRENQDLLSWIFFHQPSLFCEERKKRPPKTSNHHRPLLFIVRFVIYKRTQNTHTYKMALSMQSALAGKQITVNKVSSKRYVYLIFA